MKDKTITQNELQKRVRFFEQAEVYRPITLLRKSIAYGFIGYGALTIWAPTGSVWAIMIGCALIGIEYKPLMKAIGFYAKETYYWFYRQARRMLK